MIHILYSYQFQFVTYSMILEYVTNFQFITYSNSIVDVAAEEGWSAPQRKAENFVVG